MEPVVRTKNYFILFLKREICGYINDFLYVAFYNGSLASQIVNSVKEANGRMTLNDVSEYHTSHSELLHTKFGKFDIYTPGSSSGGSFLHTALQSIQVNKSKIIKIIILEASAKTLILSGVRLLIYLKYFYC